jgi:hypothetical protein
MAVTFEVEFNDWSYTVEVRCDSTQEHPWLGRIQGGDFWEILELDIDECLIHSGAAFLEAFVDEHRAAFEDAMYALVSVYVTTHYPDDVLIRVGHLLD